MASRPRKKFSFFNKGQGLNDLESFSVEGNHQTNSSSGSRTVNQVCQNNDDVYNEDRDIEIIDGGKTNSNSCSNVSIEKSACPPLTKSSFYTSSSEPTNFNGIISGSVAALEDSDHSFAPAHATLNQNSPVDAPFQTSYLPEKKVYTQLLSVQTGQLDTLEPYACSDSPGKHKVQSVGSNGTDMILLSRPEKSLSPSYNKVKEGYNAKRNAELPPPRPHTRRPSHPYSPYPVASPPQESWPSNMNTAKSGWSSQLEGNKSSSCSPSSSNAVFTECNPSNIQQQSYSKPISELRAHQNDLLDGSNFNRTVKQYQQPLGNCNHINADIPLPASNISLHASVQYGHGVHVSSHAGNVSYQYRFQQNYLPPSSAVNNSSALYHPNLYGQINDQNKHHSGSIKEAGDVQFIASSAPTNERSAPNQRPSPVDSTGPSAFMRVMPHRGYPHHQAPISVTLPYHSREPSSPPVINYNTNNTTLNGSSCSDDSNPAFSSSTSTTTTTIEKKRVQSCKLCRNHGVETPIKGHKYFCPHKKCQCPSCSVTLKSRHFVKEQLKITRKQNVAATQHQSDNEDHLSEARQPPASGVPFTMKEDMLKDMEKLNNLVLFKEIDKICRPQSSVKDSTSGGMES